MRGKIAAARDGRITGLWAHVTADHGGFDACADPTEFPAGVFNICTGSDDIPVASLAVRARLGIRRGRPPHGHGEGAGRRGAKTLRAEQAARVEAFRRGETRKLVGIGLSFFTAIVGAGPVKNCDVLGLGMFDSCEIRIHPTGSAIARLGTISRGEGHATTFAQVLASEIGIPADDITVEEGDTGAAPYGLGAYGSRSTPVAGAATARAGRKIRAKAQMTAARLLEALADRLGRF